MKRTAIDNEHWKWLAYCFSEVTNNAEYKRDLNREFEKRYGVTADEVYTCLKLLELINNVYWNPSDELLESKGNEPLWRWSFERLESKLNEKLSNSVSKKVIDLLTWKKGLDLYKNPLIPDKMGHLMFAHWYWVLDPNPVKMWLYPYYYSGHPLAGKAGELRGKAFEKYLSKIIHSISDQISIVPNREYHSNSHSCISTVGLEKIEIDLAIRYKEVGLIVDAKGGVEEFPKRMEDCLWNNISSDDVFHRLEENRMNAEKWDKVFTAVTNSEGILQDIGLNECKVIIPLIVHSKVQPIMIDGYTQKYGGDYTTQTHSIESFLDLVKTTGSF